MWGKVAKNYFLVSIQKRNPLYIQIKVDGNNLEINKLIIFNFKVYMYFLTSVGVWASEASGVRSPEVIVS